MMLPRPLIDAKAAAPRVALAACAALPLAVWAMTAHPAAGQGATTEAPGAPRNRAVERAARKPTGQARLREGTQVLDRLGSFQLEGSSATFVTKDGFSLGGLPNLSLERVVRTLKSMDQPDRVQWSVTGTVTEFSGQNYLLIQRAVYKSTRSRSSR